MKNLTLAKTTLLLLTIMIAGISLYAQKLPNVQKTSVYAPLNIKTDGKTTEWDNKFEAQNGATGLYYTMANDGEKLYLTIQGRDGNGTPISKMLNGGVTFTVKSDNKSVKPVVFNFLIFQSKGLTGLQKKINDPEAKIDSVLGPVNDQIAGALKEIGVKGVSDITDTLISVYNEYGIKEVVKYDNKKALTCEIAIPLKYISQLINGGTFKYNVKLNAIKMGNVSIVLNGSHVASGSEGEAKAMSLVNMIATSGGNGSDSFNDTDFSGSYTLAKK
ncbi:MAG: hypothetical protein V4592_25500 [Bacteroidota bacterium]